MKNAPAESSILLVDDGELDAVAELLEAQGRAFERMRGPAIPGEIAPPRDLLIVTPRRLDRVRRGSPANAAPGYPLRIIAVDDDSPAMRRRLRSAGAQLLVRLPADDEIWRLLIARAMYRGHERRLDPRVNIGSPVSVSEAVPDFATRPPRTVLIDLSNRGCRLHTTAGFRVDQPVSFTLAGAGEAEDPDAEGLLLRGRVRRIVQQSGAAGQMIAMTFDEDLSASVRAGLARLINRWAAGPRAASTAPPQDVPSIPPCQLPTLPDLTLDDETDPPVASRDEVRVEIDATRANPGDGVGIDATRANPGDGVGIDATRANPGDGVGIDATDGSGVDRPASRDRRDAARGQFESAVVAEGGGRPIVLIGRDLSPGGMRVDAIGNLRRDDRFRLALHGPGPTEPLIVRARVVRNDGADGFALAFEDIDDAKRRQIEKIVACLPDVESLERGEGGGIGAILSELLRD